MNFFEEFLELIFPSVCGFCGRPDKSCLCEECEKRLNLNLKYGTHSVNDKYFEKHIYVLNYEGEARDKILSYKFHDKSYMYKTFAKIILKSQKICEILKTYDIITEVPIHKKRKNERGYNQSELIAKEIAKNIDDLKYAKLLKKLKNNPRQSSLKKEKRIQNVENAYVAMNKEIIGNKRIIIFDDIYTTGATVNECARVLKEAEVKEILILSLSK